MSLPAFREDGWLPEGHHSATWDEIEERFGGAAESHRDRLYAKLDQWRDAIRGLGISGKLVLDGSFISAKEEPGDIDCLFIYDDERAILAEVDLTNTWTNYLWCKENGYGDIFVFPASAVRDFPALCRKDLYDYHKTTRFPKGVVEVEI